MKPILSLLVGMTCAAFASESFFFAFDPDPPLPTHPTLTDSHLNYSLKIRRIDPPKVSSIKAISQGEGENRHYVIQMNLLEKPKENWLPMVKLGDDILTHQISVDVMYDKGANSLITITTEELTKVRKWVGILAHLYNLPREAVTLEIDDAEQSGATQPASPQGDKVPGRVQTPTPTIATESEKGISGVYKHQELTYEFKGDKCFGTVEGKPFSESHFKIKGNLLYISPNIPDMKSMTRNVWVVWEINDDKLISKYLVDMDDGTRFYEDRAGKMILLKQEPETR